MGAHQIKNFKETQIRRFRDRLNIPIPDEKLDPEKPAYYLPPKNSPELEYLHERRKSLAATFRAASSASPRRRSRR